MKLSKPLCLFLLILFITFPAMGEKFTYKHNAGDQYRILSTVSEDVYFNGRFSHHAEIVNRIAVEVTAVSGDIGTLQAIFQTAERATASDGREVLEWSRDYNSEFDRNSLGYLTIGNEYYMPNVRNVPVFPDRELSPGEAWRAQGYEVHDFRDIFGISNPYRIDFWVDYVFLGTREWKGKSYPAFSVKYNVLIPRATPVNGRIYPTRIQGSSDQIVYWDPEMGEAAAYEETFSMAFTMSNGETFEYRGRAEAEIIEVTPMDKEQTAHEVAEEIMRLDIPGVSVRVDDVGVTINLENIQFEPDSAILVAGEKGKLDRLAQILLNYPDRDILVSGHTALAGTRESMEQLSLERARSVAEYLIERQVRTPDRIVIQGFGGDRPLASNDTEAGRIRNRRVEITILEN